MKQHSILYGVCGIGNGHIYRQLPIIEDLALDNKVVIFAYGTSLEFFLKHFQNNAHISIIEVAVPYYPGCETGLDFEAAAGLSAQSSDAYTTTNVRAMAEASRLIGRPDLVVSDYEPVSAQYAYAYDAPLVTIDQQSKYLYGALPSELAGRRYADEVMRLRMFFPLADARIACSFFRVEPRQGGAAVAIVPPVLRSKVLASATASRSIGGKLILVYLTAQAGFDQLLPEMYELLGEHPEYTFAVFLANFETMDHEPGYSNISVHLHGSPEFDEVLMSCAGIITTAGHGLLSEAMHLDLPVYALPLPLYEQQLNAAVIADNNFGVSASVLDEKTLKRFLGNLPTFTKNIHDDTVVLNRGDGAREITDIIRHKLTALGEKGAG